MNMVDKATVHFRNILKAKSIGYTYYVIITVAQRRGIPVPKIALFKNYYHIGEENIYRYLIPDTEEGCFLDVGANRGYYTIMVAKQGYKVHAFEPSPEALSTLTTDAEKYSNIILHPYALGAMEKTGLLHLHLACGHDGFIKKSTDYTGETAESRITTLDNLEIKNIDVIKIDTEGYEYPILQGARETLVNQQPRLVIEIHEPQQEEHRRIKKYLRSLGYTRMEKIYKEYRFRRPDPQYHLICEARL